jgi:hypothetical protein
MSSASVPDRDSRVRALCRVVTRPGATALVQLVLLLAATAVPAQECLDDRGHWTPGPSLALATANGRLYHGEGADLVISDLANPAAPVELGRVAIGDPVWSVAVAGSLVAVTDWWDSLYLVDVGNPAAPVVLSHVQAQFGRPYAAAIAGGHLYLASRGFGVEVLAIGDPAAPVPVGSLAIAGLDFVFDLRVVGNRLYVAADQQGLRIVDIGNPATPVALGAFTGSTDVNSVLVEGNLAYVAAGGEGIYVLDVGNPVAPMQLGQLAVAAYVRRLHKTGSHLFVATSGNGTRVIDVGNPALPIQVAQLSESAIDVAGSGSFVMTAEPGTGGAEGGRLRVLDASLPASPVAVDTIATAHYSYDVALAGTLALVANAATGLAVLDLSGPGAPVERARLDTPGAAQNVIARDGHAYVGDASAVHVVSLANPDQPVITATLPFPGFLVYDLAFAGDRLLVANGFSGLLVYDLADPAQPVAAGSFVPAGAPVTRVATDGTLALAAGGPNAWTLDLAGTGAPVQLAQFSLPGTALGVDLAGGIGLVAAATQGVLSFDLANPTAPVPLDQFAPFPLMAHDVRMRGDRAWVAGDTWWGLIELDISDPANLVATGSVDSSGSGRAVAADAARVLLADWDAGVRVFGCNAIFANGFQ